MTKEYLQHEHEKITNSPDLDVVKEEGERKKWLRKLEKGPSWSAS